MRDRTLPDGILLEHLKAFQTLYREHCEVGAQSKKQDKWRMIRLEVCFDIVPLTEVFF